MSDSDWEKEDYEPPTFTNPVLGDRWEGEDEDDVKENWDDEEAEKSGEEENAEENVTAPLQTKKKKTLSQVIAEKEEKKRKEQEAKQAEKEELENNPSTPSEIHAEKLRQMQLQEDADLELAKEAFGDEDSSQGTIDSMIPSTKEDFDSFRKALVNKITEYEKSIHFMPFLEDFLREICLNMEPEDIKKLSSVMNAVANEKVKAQKSSKHKKKTNKTRAALNVGKGDDYNLNEYGDEYDDFI